MCLQEISKRRMPTSTTRLVSTTSLFVGGYPSEGRASSLLSSSPLVRGLDRLVYCGWVIVRVVGTVCIVLALSS